VKSSPPKQVFISYSHHDEVFAADLEQALVRRGVSAFFAPRSIQPGDSFVELIENALARCQVGILLWSAAARESAWVTNEREVFAARRNRDGLRVIVVMLEKIELPALFSTVQAIKAVRHPNAETVADALLPGITPTSKIIGDRVPIQLESLDLATMRLLGGEIQRQAPEIRDERRPAVVYMEAKGKKRFGARINVNMAKDKDLTRNLGHLADRLGALEGSIHRFKSQEIEGGHEAANWPLKIARAEKEHAEVVTEIRELLNHFVRELWVEDVA